MAELKNLLETIIPNLPKQRKVSEFPTGIKKIDEEVFLSRGETLIVAARTSHGKTTFAFNNIAVSCAQNGKVVHYYSLEDSTTKLTTRYIAHELDIDSKDIRRNKLTEEQYGKMNAFLASTKGGAIPIYIWDNIGFNFEEIRQNIKEFSVKPDVVIIDYVNKIPKGMSSRNDVVTEYSHNLTKLTKECNCLGVLCCQINREAQGDGNTTNIHEPQLHHLRDSGSLEQDAQSVIFLHYQYKYTQDPNDKYKIELIVAKNKDGDTGRIPCYITPEYNKIQD